MDVMQLTPVPHLEFSTDAEWCRLIAARQAGACGEWRAVYTCFQGNVISLRKAFQGIFNLPNLSDQWFPYRADLVQQVKKKGKVKKLWKDSPP